MLSPLRKCRVLSPLPPLTTISTEPGPVTTAADDKYLFWTKLNYGESAGDDGEIVRVCR